MQKKIYIHMLFVALISMTYLIFPKTLPFTWLFVGFIFLLCYLLSSRLTRAITRPINNMDFERLRQKDALWEPSREDEEQSSLETEYYDELSPFIKTILRQKEQINEQMIILENRADMIKRITEGMREGLIMLDKKGVILFVNISAVSLFENNPHLIDFAGKNILELTRNMNILDGIKTAFQGDYCNIVLPFGVKTVQVSLSPVFKAEEVNGAIILFLDITEKANAEKNRREFSANVSHELKTPLTTILGLSEMLSLNMAKKEDIANFAEKIKTEVLRLIDLINDIIRLSELDEKAGEKQLEPFDLLELTGSIVGNLKQFADEKAVMLEISGESFHVTANKRMMDELLYNLIDNGIKYNKKGGKVTVSLSRESGAAAITVSDTGTGIPDEHVDRVFERFYRVDKSRSKKTGGTGLGLSIVKHIALYHHGHVELKSKENVGTTIKVVFPESV